MRLPALLFTATLVSSPLQAQPATPPAVSPAGEPSSAVQDSGSSAKPQPNSEQKPVQASDQEPKPDLNLPVSLDKIREALQKEPALSLRVIDDKPIFRVEILERQKIEELLSTLNFKTGPTPAGGVYMFEQQRQMFNPVDRPLMQPYAAFNTGQLLTILIENLVGKYLGGKAIDAVSKLERAHAEANAREEVRAAVAQYCNAQPNLGAGIQICDTAR